MICVNGLKQAQAALVEASERPAHLISPPFAACHAGVGYYAALIAALRQQFHDSDFTFTLCCGDDPAMAHDALRRGFTRIVCDAGAAQHALSQLAASLGASVLNRYPA